jgi:hypothetical protein
LKGLESITVRKVLRAARADYETQRRFLSQVFSRVELLRGALRFVPVVEVEALVVRLPKYYAPRRGKQVVDLEGLLQ